MATLLLALAMLGFGVCDAPAAGRAAARVECRSRCTEAVAASPATPRAAARRERACRRRVVRACVRRGSDACPVTPDDPCAGAPPPMGLAGVWEGARTGCEVRCYAGSGAYETRACSAGEDPGPALRLVLHEACGGLTVSEPFSGVGSVVGDDLRLSGTSGAPGPRASLGGTLDGDAIRDVRWVVPGGGFFPTCERVATYDQLRPAP